MVWEWDELNCVTPHNEHSGSCSGHFCLKSKAKNQNHTQTNKQINNDTPPLKKTPNNNSKKTQPTKKTKPNKPTKPNRRQKWHRGMGRCGRAVYPRRAGDRRGQHQRAALLEPPLLPLAVPPCPFVSLLTREEHRGNGVPNVHRN